jgi:hypothetical protein
MNSSTDIYINSKIRMRTINIWWRRGTSSGRWPDQAIDAANAAVPPGMSLPPTQATT